MKRTIRLNESQLSSIMTRVIKKVLRESAKGVLKEDGTEIDSDDREQPDGSSLESEIERIAEREIGKALNEKTSEPDRETKRKFEEEDGFWRKQMKALERIWGEMHGMMKEIGIKEEEEGKGFGYTRYLTDGKLKLHDAMKKLGEARDMLYVYRNKALQSTGEQPDRDYYEYGENKTLRNYLERSKHGFFGKLGGTVKN